MNFTITLDASARLADAIDNLANVFLSIAALSANTLVSSETEVFQQKETAKSGDHTTLETETAPVKRENIDDQAPTTAGKQEPEENDLDEQPVTDPAPGTTVYTLADVRAFVAKKTEEGKRQQMKELLTYFGVPNVAALPPDKFGEFMQKAEVV